MKKINVIYWSGENFGDALSPRLIEELTGLPTQYKSWQPSYAARLKNLIGKIVRLRFAELGTILWPQEKSIIAVGSVIRWGNSRSQVWGSGFMNSDEPFGGGEIYAVRGKLTSQKLLRMGYPKCEILGDPALLLPLWIPARKVKKHKLGIIPHWKEVEAFQDKLGDNFNIIDLRTHDVERIVRAICDCEYILSTSLHGLIVAHAYGIPALWIKEGYIDTDGFKFRDYFSSVDIPFYEGFENLEEIFASESAWMSLFEVNSDKANSRVDLKRVQRRLLKAFPFSLRSKYQSLITYD
ncbi:polysaccharide pyruvyl transferase family protein [Sphingobacterium sp. BIGb0165]|uniref:polysaccharide pyruvyl transferase family protein n=1 Tax=Sphingobacterium sp. BIGb0165 TaxID=2940615 RepID=UPI00216A4219|nr:polysaccharide pyruvyl transferase family protein [Sphingobacterium sp. BIGb0165]MCS4226489.1 hypothetical protein [Sphingobacterium sp. BIGb0165]